STVSGGRFLLLSSTFQDARFSFYSGAHFEPELRDHVETIFGDNFMVERTEPGIVNAGKDQKPLPALAFWLIRNRKKEA
ncbi:hypothetical protein ACH0C8_16445, partial [Acetobacter lovaniensis]|uniref:hypothetical protein n=1 Tax=Acetobacter lovaniensis TaxID=104100 RepID=UPI00377042B8